MEEKIEKSKIFIPSELEPGAYNFYVRVTYGQYSAESHRQIEINKEGKMSSSIKSALFYIIPLLILIIILLLIIVIKIEKKKLKNFFIYEEEWILTHKLAICLLYLSLVSIGLILILGYLEIISLPIPGDYLLNARLFIEFVIIPYLYLILAITISIIVLSLVVKHKKQAHRQIYGEKYRPKRKNRLERILKHIKSKIINNKIREDVILLGKKGYDVDLIGKENMQKRLADWKKKGYNTESIGLKKENMQKRLADWKKKGYDVSSLER